MTALKDLLTQKAELEKQIELLSQTQRSDAISQIRTLMADHGLTLADLTAKPSGAKSSAATGRKLAPRYRDPDSGSTWSGRGLRPKWLQAAIESGRKLEDFAVQGALNL